MRRLKITHSYPPQAHILLCNFSRNMLKFYIHIFIELKAYCDFSPFFRPYPDHIISGFSFSVYKMKILNMKITANLIYMVF